MPEQYNSFKELEAKWEACLPRELERRVANQANNFTVFGRVVEVFVPNALQTVIRMIDGSGDDTPHQELYPGRRPAADEWPDWRKPPGR